MNPQSIRFRVAAWYLVVLFAAMLAFSLGTWFALREVLWAHLDNSLLARTQAVGHFLEKETHSETLAALREETREFASSVPADHGLRVTTETGEVLFERSGPQEARVRRIQADVYPKGHHLRAELIAPTESIFETLDLLRNVLLAVVPFMLLVAGLGGWWLSRRALQPVDDMTAAAETLSIRDVSARLAVPPTGDELQRLGEAWNRMLDRIAASVQQMSRFTMDAAHELRTPAAIIQSSAELALRRERSPAEYRGALQTIEDESQRLTSMVQDLLLLARNDSGGTLQRQELNARELVLGTLRMIEPLAARKQLSLALKPLDEDVRLFGDPTLLRRLLLILLDNAIKFSPPESTIEVETSFGIGQTVRVQVKDRGPGISAEDLPHIFERFYRANSARIGPGSGLGLAIAKAIVDEHEGTISLRSTPLEGTIATIGLPRA